LRLTGGSARGRRIRGPGRLRIRPTSDRVREALFDILGDRVAEATFLDCYAGTGAVGIEALSRGARRVLFLERDRAALEIIRTNLALESWRELAEVIAGEVEHSLDRLARRDDRCDIIFLDPPYDPPVDPRVLRAAAGLLDPLGVLVVEHRSNQGVEAPEGGLLRPARRYRYGDTALSSFVPAGGAART
jgi:16S rRNA (guanine(966)-N(2))-methyltransferase RsmD